MAFRLISAVWGPEKSGKTHFALTFPEPIHFLNYDYGLEDLMSQFPGKRIIPHNIGEDDPYSLDNLLGESPKVPMMKKVLTIYRDSMREAGKEGGTVVVDTFGQMRQTISDGTLAEIIEKRIGTKTEGMVYPFDYAKSNFVTGEVIRMAYKIEGVSLVLIHRASPIYDEKGNDTGRVKMSGWHEVPAAVAVTVKTYRDPKGEFKMRIESCRKDPNAAGMELDNPGFETLRGLLED